MPENVEKELNDVGFALVEAEKYGLEIEVMLYAIKYAQRNPEATVEACVNHGLEEWIK